MDRSLMWWSWKYEQVSPQVTIHVALHTQQVTWYLISVFLLSRSVEILRFQSAVVILHSLFWWLLPPGPKLNDRDHHRSVHRPHLHHHLCFYYCLQRQKQVTRVSNCTDNSADCLYNVYSHRFLAKALPWCLCNFVRFLPSRKPSAVKTQGESVSTSGSTAGHIPPENTAENTDVTVPTMNQNHFLDTKVSTPSVVA